MGRSLHPRVFLPLALVAGALLGCTAEDVQLLQPGGSELAVGLTVNVEAEDATLAEALGWSEGVPGAEVRLQRRGTGWVWESALTDSAGTARFPDILPGSYRLAGYRALTEEEVAELGDRRRAFGGGAYLEFSGPREHTLRLAADEPGSLVISEIYGTQPNEAGHYFYHHYAEIYNNSDSEVYLDGMIYGVAYDWNYCDPAVWEQAERLVLDGGGVWGRFFYQFPGSGTEYPLAPGGSAVIARDAVDHSQFFPGYPDLSQADFELLGSADVDNPAVPNLLEVSPRSHPEGHGEDMSLGQLYFLCEAVDPESLPKALTPQRGYPLVRFPAGRLLDVVATHHYDAYIEQRIPQCHPMVHPSFDQLEGGYVLPAIDVDFSIQRIVLGYTADGRAILQDTNTSAIEFLRAHYTLGTLLQ
ncbi:MAG: DUF4876 domain-containing protein [Gemmatimonadales bacterium]|jgi:hypothetical protein